MTNRLNGLTILRFFASFWVVLFHLENRVALPAGQLLTNFFFNGAYAMSFFFILSGVVLAYGYRGLRSEPADIGRFYQARVARIYPTYAVIHLLALLSLTAMLPDAWVKWTFINTLSALGLQAWFPHTVIYGANGGTWSISTEFFFYALFPALLPLLKWAQATLGVSRTVLYLSLLVGFYGIADYAFEHKDTFMYYSMPFLRLPEFMLGMSVGLTVSGSRPAASGRSPWPALGLAIVMVLVAAVNPVRTNGWLWMRLNIVVVPALAWLIYTTARTEQRLPAGRPAGRLTRVFVYLGESSYCFFLMNLVPLMYLDSDTGGVWRDDFLRHHSPGALWLLVIGVTLAGAIALHELVEKPAQRALLRRWRGPRGALAAAA